MTGFLRHSILMIALFSSWSLEPMATESTTGATETTASKTETTSGTTVTIKDTTETTSGTTVTTTDTTETTSGTTVTTTDITETASGTTVTTTDTTETTSATTETTTDTNETTTATLKTTTDTTGTITDTTETTSGTKETTPGSSNTTTDTTETTSGTTVTTTDTTETTSSTTVTTTDITETTSGTTETKSDTTETTTAILKTTTDTTGTILETTETTSGTKETTPGSSNTKTDTTETITDIAEETTTGKAETTLRTDETTSGTAEPTTVMAGSTETVGTETTEKSTETTTITPELTTNTTETTRTNEITTGSTSSIDTVTTVPTSINQESTVSNGQITKPLNSLRIKIDLQIIIPNVTFNLSFNDPSSSIYKSYERAFKSKLQETYSNIMDFDHVIINGFRNGSVVCNYTFVMYADANISQVQKNITDLNLNLNGTNMTINGQPLNIIVDITTINDTFNAVIDKKDNICKLIDRPCENYENCQPGGNTSIQCTHKCVFGNSCSNGGVCIYDDREEKTKCKCASDGDTIYYGPTCRKQAENLALHKSEIIGIGAGCGGGIVVILLVVIIVLVRRKATKGKDRDPKSALSKEISMGDIRHQRVFDSVSSNGFKDRSDKRAQPNPYGPGVAETKYLHGRAHNIYKDSNGEETYIYSPLSFTPPKSGSRNRDSGELSGISMYDYIDTDSKFEIQRPRVRPNSYGGF